MVSRFIILNLVMHYDLGSPLSWVLERLQSLGHFYIHVLGTTTQATRGKRPATLSTTTVAIVATTAEATDLAVATEAVTITTEAAAVGDGEIELDQLSFVCYSKGWVAFILVLTTDNY